MLQPNKGLIAAGVFVGSCSQQRNSSTRYSTGTAAERAFPSSEDVVTAKRTALKPKYSNFLQCDTSEDGRVLRLIKHNESCSARK